MPVVPSLEDVFLRILGSSPMPRIYPGGRVSLVRLGFTPAAPNQTSGRGEARTGSSDEPRGNASNGAGLPSSTGRARILC